MLPLSELLRSAPRAAVIGALVLVAALALGAAKAKTKSPRTKDGKSLPRPESTLPLLENTLDMVENSARMHDWVSETTAKLGGKPWLLRVLGQPQTIVLTTPEALEDVESRNFDKFSKGPYLHDLLFDLAGNSFSFVDGELWAFQRKTASRLFSSRAIRDHMAVIANKHTIVLDEVLEKAVANSIVVDIAELLLHFTMETIAEIAFGLDIQSLASDEVHPFETAIDDAQHYAISRVQVPTFVWKLKRFFGVGSERELARCISVVDDTVMTIIRDTMAKTREEKEAGKVSERKDAVSLFLESADSESMLTPKLLRDITLALIVGGRDTTADTLGWLLYLLSPRPEVEKKIREEITALFGSNIDVTQQLSHEKLSQMVYAEATIKETLRLYPAASWNLRYSHEDVVLSDGTFIPQGSYAAIAPYVMGRRTDVWGEDATEFKPERWIDPKDPSKLVTVSNYKFNSFLAGPRQCIGMNFAMLEMKVVMVKMLSKFHLEVMPGQTVTYRQSLALPIKDGLKVRVHHAA